MESSKDYLKNFFEKFNVLKLSSDEEINSLNILSLENYGSNFNKTNKKEGLLNVGKNF